ncbi:hypothetical protein BDY24DRAFT_430052 [Mrakia frigida]|uniref:uncharacterized protein n=1 Tax=Mrakia frigida TaxID=29902 RepID=UPI003FCBFD2B
MSFLPPGQPEERSPMIQLRNSTYQPEPLLRPCCTEDRNISIVEFLGIGPEGRRVNFERIFDFTWTIQSILEPLRYKARTGPDQIFEISYTWKHGQLQGDLNRGSLRRTRSRLVPSGRRLRSLLPPSLRPSPPTPTSDVPRGYDRLSSSPFSPVNPFDLIRTAYALKLKFRQGTTCPRYGRRDSSTSSDGRGWTASSVVQAAISPPNNGQDTPKQTLPSSGQGRSTVGILLA